MEEPAGLQHELKTVKKLRIILRISRTATKNPFGCSYRRTALTESHSRFTQNINAVLCKYSQHRWVSKLPHPQKYLLDRIILLMCISALKKKWSSFLKNKKIY